MKSKYIMYGIAAIVLVTMIWILGDTFTQPGIKDLQGHYEEVAMYRNENNTGPVLRVYAVYTADTLWEDMEAYGQFMPHTKYGNTKVFFFSDPIHIPTEVFPEPPHFDPKLQPYCVAKYEKSSMGETHFLRFPYQ